MLAYTKRNEIEGKLYKIKEDCRTYHPKNGHKEGTSKKGQIVLSLGEQASLSFQGAALITEDNKSFTFLTYKYYKVLLDKKVVLIKETNLELAAFVVGTEKERSKK